MFLQKMLQNVVRIPRTAIGKSFLRSINRDLKSRKKWSKTKKVAVGSLFGGASMTGVLMYPSLLGSTYNVQDISDYNLSKLSLEYNIAAIESFFQQRRGEVLGRVGEIISLVAPFTFRLLVWEYLIRRKIRESEGLQKRYAVELREMLTKLGPCFIKLGQAMSIRPDLLPSPFLFELQKLCDAVPSFPTEDALKVIEHELGRPVEDIFLELNSTVQPIAAASLGQVYRVRLKDEGEEVAVKVQRPDMLQAVLRDIYIIRQYAKFVDYVKSKITNQRPFDVALIDKFASANLKELDYINEASNQIRFKEELEPRMNNRIYVPKVYTKYTTRKVLVTEWIEGKQLAKSSQDVINRLTPVGVECFLIQLLETAFFHADPHPGNLLVTTDGKLALIDFGLCAEVPVQDTTTMTLTIVHLMQGNVEGLVEDAVKLNFLPPDVNRETLIPVLQKVYDSAQLAVKETVNEEKKQRKNFKAVERRRKYFMDVSSDLNKIFFNYPFLVPDYFALITRAMIVLEGIALTGDPGFDLFQSAYPFSLKRAVQLFGYGGVAKIAKEALVRMTDLGIDAQYMKAELKTLA